MFNLATTSDLVERLSILEEPFERLETPICRRCKVALRQRLYYAKGVIEVVWKCPKCFATVRESE